MVWCLLQMYHSICYQHIRHLAFELGLYRRRRLFHLINESGFGVWPGYARRISIAHSSICNPKMCSLRSSIFHIDFLLVLLLRGWSFLLLKGRWLGTICRRTGPNSRCLMGRIGHFWDSGMRGGVVQRTSYLQLGSAQKWDHHQKLN